MDLIIVGLATWRISHLFIYEEGPGDILGKIRAIFGVTKDRFPSRSMFVCMWCMSIWVGLLLAVLPVGISLPFALSAIAIIVDTVIIKWQ